MPDDPNDLLFRILTEIGIIDQISTAFLEARLPKGLIAPHFGVVNHLIRVEDGQTPLALARAFQVPKTTMTHTLAGLEKQGFVEMRPNPDDGRSKRVWLTEAGRAFRDQTVLRLLPVFERLADEVPPDHLEKLLPLLSSFRQTVDRLRDEMG
ncbi:MAG: MarR family transcriptional regulator [Pseudomonadota bacterium]